MSKIIINFIVQFKNKSYVIKKEKKYSIQIGFKKL
jgi:hypothetical protein